MKRIGNAKSRIGMHGEGSVRPRTAQEQQRCEVRGSGREEQYTARNRRGVDLRSKDGHRQSGEKRRVATEGLRIAKNGTESQRHGIALSG